MTLKKSVGLIIVLLLIDQISKFYIKTHFVLGERIVVTDWFQILFVENEGMAWGAKIPGEFGKLFLTLFRIIAVGLIGYWLVDLVKKQSSRLSIVAVSLIFAGAMGNIIDSVFYGLLFSESYTEIAQFLPDGGGYGTLFHGKVVDMLSFPIYEGYLPEWIPFWGGDYFTFFDPVFNIADTAISTGVGLLLVFNKKAFPKESKTESLASDVEN